MPSVARILIERRQDDPHDVDVFRRLAQLFEGGDLAGEPDYGPPVDVVEHADRIELTADLPGVPAEAIRVIFSRGTVVVAGKKLPRACTERVAFHLAERRFGRFVRAIGLTGALDAGAATAALADGELRVVLPRIEERRGRDIHIEVTRGLLPPE
jgi:HSP20 family protein